MADPVVTISWVDLETEALSLQQGSSHVVFLNFIPSKDELLKLAVKVLLRRNDGNAVTFNQIGDGKTIIVNCQNL